MMKNLPRTQHDILFRLKTRGPLSAQSLAQQLGITGAGVRQHLSVLAGSGLVVQMTTPTTGGRGRPVRKWQLTDLGHREFPDAHADVTVSLIASVRELFGESGIDNLIEKRTQQTLALYSEALSGCDTPLQRLQIISRMRSDEGYMSEVKELGSNSWLLIENHCPICAAATACQGFCRSELEVFEALLDGVANIERINHILAGARRCAYKVTALAECA